jgi:hypothetical protein
VLILLLLVISEFFLAEEVNTFNEVGNGGKRAAVDS